MACPDDSNREISCLYISSWISLLADSPLVTCSSEQKPRKSFAKFRREILTRPLLDTIIRYSTLADTILQGCNSFGEFSVTGEWVPDMIHTPIFKEYHEWFRSGNPRLLTYIISFLYFGKKLDYDDEVLKTVAFHRWQGVEERLSTLELPPTLVGGLRTVVRNMLPRIKVQCLAPSFGPGKVAEPGMANRIQKSNDMLHDRPIEYAFGRPNIFMDENQTGFAFKDVVTLRVKRSRKTFKRYSVFRQVKKSVKTARTICKQPNRIMYWEQSYARHLRVLMKKGWMRWYVDLEDQSMNRKLASYGSATGFIDTIDLSDASDTVHVKLVEQIFPREVLFFLKALRIKDVKVPGGLTVRVNKFAPMGSALCFPVQCMVFLSVLVYSAMQYVSNVPVGQDLDPENPFLRDPQAFLERYVSKSPGYFTKRSRRINPLRAYGDDLECDSNVTPFVIHNLSKLGFVVNVSKSFTGGQAVRESCGGYYHCGDDVTPLLFRVKQWSKSKDVKGVESIIAAINAAGDHRFFNYKRCLTQFLLWSGVAGGVKPAQILFTPDRRIGAGIFHPSPKNKHLVQRRYNKDLQRDEVRCLMVVTGEKVFPRPSEETNYENYLHTQWWIEHGPSYRESDQEPERFQAPQVWDGSDGRVMVHHDPGPTRLARKWIPELV